MDSPAGSELFGSYEQDYEAIKISITERLNASGNQTGEPKKQTLRAADREIDEAAEILQQMDMELMNLPQGSRTRLQARLRGYKSELERLKQTLALGAGILTDLRGQREQIVYTRNTLLEADSNIDKSSRTLKAMARRMATNKLITASIIGVLVFLILFVLYRKIFH
ncbi:hypothetical protein BGZ50_002595 [Haplosporangium sp. Z 11]|nr:hypothetical protein BGZ50_002595 [Haplosporangium sp. Z 11]